MEFAFSQQSSFPLKMPIEAPGLRMRVSKNILLLFEDGDVREESLHYAVELVRRMRCALQILVLVGVGREHEIRAMNLRLDEVLGRCVPPGIDCRKEIRCGDKASELLKYLAVNAAVGTMVWGSDESALMEKGERKSRHWLSKVKTKLQCPVVTSRVRRP
jgi:hypothetical protein